MISNPLVSIIIPVYNKAPFVRETLDSALAQKYPHIELVLVNDGSTDGSLEILDEYAKQFPDKIYLIDAVNQGVSAATNLGISSSKGEFIQFLDADDLLSADKIEKQIKLLYGRQEEEMVTCEWVIFKDSISNVSSIPYCIFQDFDSGLDLLLRFWNHQEMMAISSFLTHRSLIEKAGPWDESLTINQDGEFFCRVLLQAKRVLYEPKGKVYYRIPGSQNVSQQKTRKAWESLLDSCKLYEKNILKIEDSDRVRIALKKIYQKFIYDCFPNHPDLIKEAETLMKGLHVADKTYIGGPKFQKLSKFLGFKNALRLKRRFKQ